MDLAAIQQTTEGLFPELLGIEFTEATPDRVAARLTVREELCTLPGLLHGGAIMAFADTLGAYGTSIALAGGRTTTIESKTNFFGRVETGESLTAVATPLHKGRTTQVWQTRLEVGDRLVAVVTQTQLVFAAAPS